MQNLAGMVWCLLFLSVRAMLFFCPCRLYHMFTNIVSLLYSLYTHKLLLLPEEIYFFNSTQISSNLENVWQLPCSSIFPWLLVFLPSLSSYLFSCSFFLLMSWGPVQIRHVCLCLSSYYLQLFHLKVYLPRIVFAFTQRFRIAEYQKHWNSSQKTGVNSWGYGKFSM